MPEEPLVTCHDLALAHGRHRVLDGVTLTIGAGEFWAFLGPNGQGKSSMLQGLLGLLPPQAGQLRLAPALAGGRLIGYVPQHLGWRQRLPCTVQEFVRLGLVNLPVPRVKRRERVHAALEQVRIAPLAARDMAALSGGERQRALIARALVRRPQLLLLDEPTTGLDIAAAAVLVECLTALHEGGLSIVLVTHDLRLAARLATHAALFRDSHVRSGPAAELLTPETVAAIFGMEVTL